MSAKLSDKLKSTVKEYFGLYKDRDALYVTCDGNVFLDKNPAVDHARKAKRDMWEVKRTDLDKKSAPKELTQEEALDKIAKTDKLDKLRLSDLQALAAPFGFTGEVKADFVKQLLPLKEANKED